MSRMLARVIALTLAFPCSAWAQILGARITAGGGIDAVLRDGDQHLPAVIGQLGLEWRQDRSRGAFRLGLMHYQQSRNDSDAGFSGCTAACTSRKQFALSGLTADGTFDLARGRLRPYVSSGAGLYQMRNADRVNYDCSYSAAGVRSCSYTSGQTREFKRAQLTGAMHSGFGLSANVGRATLMTELRVMIIATPENRARGLIPVTVGVKF